MTFEKMFQNAKTMLQVATAADVDGHIAVQVNVTGDGSGIFYIEATEGNLFVEPYDYVDHDAVLTADSADLLDALEKAETELLLLEGDLEKISAFRSILATLPAPKKEVAEPVTKPEAAPEKPCCKPAAPIAPEKPAAVPKAEPVKSAPTAAVKAEEKKPAVAAAKAASAVKTAAPTAKPTAHSGRANGRRR